MLGFFYKSDDRGGRTRPPGAGTRQQPRHPEPFSEANSTGTWDNGGGKKLSHRKINIIIYGYGYL